MATYNGHYTYDHSTVSGWQSAAIGVYYCGQIGPTGALIVHYVGVGTGSGGVRDRLLCHLREDYWPDATHFGFSLCSTANEALVLEAAEIKRLQPRYNIVGK